MSVSLNWAWTRRLLAVAGLLTWLPRGAWVPEVYSSAGVVVAAGDLPLVKWFVLAPWQAWAVWGVLVGGLLTLLFRPSRVVSGLVLLAGIVLVYSEGLDTKAYDRLFLLQFLALTWAGDGEGQAGRDARTLQILIFAAIYGSTGWSKLLYEPAWATGDVLPGHLVDVHFGLRPVGMLALQAPWVLTVMGWWTVAFEVLFPFLIWVPVARPILLLLGVGFHIGIFATMNVRTFSLIAIAGYPAMASRAEWEVALRLLHRFRGVVLGGVGAWALALALPVLVARLRGPWPGAAWTPPDTALQAQVRAELDALVDGDPAAVVQARWGGTSWTRGAGPTVSLLSEPGAGADARTGTAVLLLLSETLPEDIPHRVRLLVGGPALLGEAPGEVWWIGPVGHHASHRGAQVWPSPWDWVLPARGTFLGFWPAVPAWWRTGSPVDSLQLPDGNWGPEGLPADATRVTDTGGWRSPGRREDNRASLDDDQVTRVVQAFRDHLLTPD